ncbi:hypothetical protein BO71DRAFT_189223 [Aspergillus ellipticus CBS 707.79]|uniref:Uncharacterized protein n=1 Tax=Aspergillus ellipticus CBS 707.79 TaxID=1448320 RepID=A0A319DF63_9EURO|nr:hypothetical protein BO71DRAFT_189223 [Aspergillus ellipticus CBS 707.79]
MPACLHPRGETCDWAVSPSVSFVFPFVFAFSRPRPFHVAPPPPPPPPHPDHYTATPTGSWYSSPSQRDNKGASRINNYQRCVETFSARAPHRIVWIPAGNRFEALSLRGPFTQGRPPCKGEA